MFNFYTKSDYNRVLPEVLLQSIQQGEYATEVNRIRSLLTENGAEVRQSLTLFAHLPKYAPAGDLFLIDGELELVDYTQMVALEYRVVDNGQVQSLFEAVSGDKYTYAAYVNAFGNGVIIWVKTDTPMKRNSHRWTHLALQTYYRELTGVGAENNGSEWGDTFEVSFDPDLFHNPDADIFPSDTESINQFM